MGPSHDSTSQPVQQVRHESFYFDYVVLRVEGVLFRVNRQPFEDDSKVFRDMYMLPVAEGSVVDGSSDKHPLVLEGVKKAEFVQLLRVLYPRKYAQKDILTVDEWISVLKLADMWQFNMTRKCAIVALRKMLASDLLQRIVLAQRFEIKEWLLPDLNELARREEPLGMHEAEQIGLEFAFRVAAVRESYTLAGHCDCRCAACADPWRRQQNHQAGITRAHHDFTEKIQSVFHTELASRPAPEET
ncbi:hypothetical protein AcW1_005180 [Taiwanofungus camphoratus]|nr:hypothetical protein AcW2_003952 [Antrodia cinnamomea]KAI0933345.1 hypothetical protein AcV5_005509 [Antrodia cinnamomea]KAI0956524.1 hypothetical protein AcW1_005180 [Antrodia cinnamomea]